jgi:death-on-curing protein
LVLDATQADQIREHGGLPGIRNENMLESALARPRNKWAYGDVCDLAELAASYGFALISNHPYLDGNKRIGLLAIATFLGINGREFDASDEEVLTTILAVASGVMSEDKLAAWTRQHLHP